MVSKKEALDNLDFIIELAESYNDMCDGEYLLDEAIDKVMEYFGTTKKSRRYVEVYPRCVACETMNSIWFPKESIGKDNRPVTFMCDKCGKLNNVSVTASEINVTLIGGRL